MLLWLVENIQVIFSEIHEIYIYGLVFGEEREIL